LIAFSACASVRPISFDSEAQRSRRRRGAGHSRRPDCLGRRILGHPSFNSPRPTWTPEGALQRRLVRQLVLLLAREVAFRSFEVLSELRRIVRTIQPSPAERESERRSSADAI